MKRLKHLFAIGLLLTISFYSIAQSNANEKIYDYSKSQIDSVLVICYPIDVETPSRIGRLDLVSGYHKKNKDLKLYTLQDSIEISEFKSHMGQLKSSTIMPYSSNHILLNIALLNILERPDDDYRGCFVIYAHNQTNLIFYSRFFIYADFDKYEMSQNMYDYIRECFFNAKQGN